MSTTPPFLAIDVGNTQIVAGALTDDSDVLFSWRFPTERDATPDALLAALRADASFAAVAKWSGSAICSVVPPVDAALVEAASRATGTPTLLLRPDMKLDVRNAYSNPEEVGMDRLANAEQGVALHGAPLLVLDFGTATTIDIVSREKVYLGGVIMPGLRTTAEALHLRTAKLPRISIERPGTAIGRNTVDAMRSGIWFGCVDGALGVARRVAEELGYSVPMLATGGLSSVLARDLPGLVGVDEHLTLRGTQRIWRRNRPAAGA